MSVRNKKGLYDKEKRYYSKDEVGSHEARPDGVDLPDNGLKIENIMRFDADNIPKWNKSSLMNELNEKETINAIHDHEKSAFTHGATRTEPHDRLVLIQAEDDKRSITEVMNKDYKSLETEGKNEPVLALVDKENFVRGEVPLHEFLEYSGVDRLVWLVDTGQLSLTYSGLPEASYRRMEDGMNRGRDAYAGTINGEAEYSYNKDMSLTVTNFLKSDNIHAVEETRSGSEEARRLEKEEEKIDKGYTGDYRGWNDPDYEPDDDLERNFGDEYL